MNEASPQVAELEIVAEGEAPGKAVATPDLLENVVSFWSFFSKLFVPLSGLDIPLYEEIHRKAAEVLEDAFFGRLPEATQWLILNILPRVGKTKLLEAWVCWELAYFPDTQWIYTCYSGPLAERSLAYIKRTLQAPWYIELFGEILHGGKADHLTTLAGGNVYGEGTGGELTGKGAGLKRRAGGAFIVDDASKPDEALSPVSAENVRRWFETTAKSRRNSDRWCPFVISGQRLAPKDLPGYIDETYRDQTKVVRFPGLVNPTTRQESDADDAVSIAPETIRTETLQAMKRTRYGRFVLASQYQQRPTSLGGNLILTEEFRRYDLTPGMQFVRKVITCDTAFTKKEENDYCVLQLWGQPDQSNHAYLVDQIRGHWDSPELLKQAALFWRRHNDEQFPIGRFLVEAATAGFGLMQQLNELGVPTDELTRVKDKASRVQDILPYISNGMVFLPNDAPWIDDLLGECAAFSQAMNHSHDDQVDCLVDGIQELLGGGGGILSLYGA